jgi:hypothetical protein
MNAADTARDFRVATGALRVVLLIDTDQGAVMVDSTPEGTQATGEAPAIPLPHVHAIPATALSIDLETGRLSAPIGAIDLLKRGVEVLAKAYGGRSVVTAEFATDDPDVTITLAAREGETTLLEAGEKQFQLGAD